MGVGDGGASGQAGKQPSKQRMHARDSRTVSQRHKHTIRTRTAEAAVAIPLPMDIDRSRVIRVVGGEAQSGPEGVDAAGGL